MVNVRFGDFVPEVHLCPFAVFLCSCLLPDESWSQKVPAAQARSLPSSQPPFTARVAGQGRCSAASSVLSAYPVPAEALVHVRLFPTFFLASSSSMSTAGLLGLCALNLWLSLFCLLHRSFSSESLRSTLFSAVHFLSCIAFEMDFKIYCSIINNVIDMNIILIRSYSFCLFFVLAILLFYHSTLFPFS